MNPLCLLALPGDVAFPWPPSLFVQRQGCAARKECSLGMVIALCPQACLPDLGGEGHSLTLVIQREIC